MTALKIKTEEQDTKDLIRFATNNTSLEIVPFHERYFIPPEIKAIETYSSISILAIDKLTFEKIWAKFPAANKDAQDAFRKEIAIHGNRLRNIKHPNILPILEFANSPDNGIGIITPFMENGTLSQFIENTNPEDTDHLRVVANIMIQMCSALQELENHGIDHYDVKPENFFLDEDRKGKKKIFKKIKLGDFGLSRPKEYMNILRTRRQISYALHETTTTIWQDTRHTPLDMIYGTPAYMSPERLSGTHEIDMPKSELFTIGVIAFMLLTQKHPYDLLNTPLQLVSTFQKIMSTTPRIDRNLNKQSNVTTATRETIYTIIESLLKGRIRERGKCSTKDKRYEINSYKDLIKALTELDWSNGRHPNPPKYNQLPNKR